MFVVTHEPNCFVSINFTSEEVRRRIEKLTP